MEQRKCCKRLWWCRMVRLTVVNSNTIKRKIKVLIGAGIIGVASYAAVKGFGRLGNYLDTRNVQINVERLIGQGEYATADNAIGMYEKKGISSKLLSELKKELADSKLESEKKSLAEKLESDRKSLIVKKDSVNTSIDSLITNGQLGKAECTLAQFEKFYTQSQIDSIKQVITENSEPYTYAHTKDPVNGENFKEKYLNKFEDGPHRKELILNLLGKSYNNVIDLANTHSDISDLSKSLNNYKKQLERFKSEGILLQKGIGDNLDCISYQYASVPEFVSSYKISNISTNMPVKVGNETNDKLNESYVKERNHNIPSGTSGKVIDYNSSDNVVFVEFEKSCTWSRNWDIVSHYWKDKKNVAAYSADELLYSCVGQKSAQLSKDLSDVLNLLENNYSQTTGK